MSVLRTRLLVLTTAVGLIGDPPLGGQALVRQGSEFQVNSFTLDYQSWPAAGIDASGAFVVVWASKGQDGADYGIFGRRFDPEGAGLGVEFQVNSFTASRENAPRLGVAADGSFVVVWYGDDQDGWLEGVFAQRFAAGGAPLGTEFQVNVQTMNTQSYPTVGMEADGDFVVAWHSQQDGSSHGVFARRFGSDGTPLGSEFQVNSYTLDSQKHLSIAVNDDGRFVVAWWSDEQEGSRDGVFAQRFDASGPVGSELQVNSTTAGRQQSAAVAMYAGGDFVVSWTSFDASGSSDIFAQRFDADGAPVAVEFQVNTTGGLQLYSDVVARDGGDFVVAWSNGSGDSGIFARVFDSGGSAVGGELRIETDTEGVQLGVDLAANAGDLLATWTSGQDGSGKGVFAQRFAAPAVLDVDADGSIGPLTDGLLILRYLFGLTGPALIEGATGAGCTRLRLGRDRDVSGELDLSASARFRARHRAAVRGGDQRGRALPSEM